MKKNLLFAGFFAAVAISAAPVEVKPSQIYLPSCASYSVSGVCTVTVEKKGGIQNLTLGPVWNVPVKEFAGKTLTISAEMRSENVDSDAANIHFGGKIQVATFLENGKILWNVTPVIRGNTDWKKYTLNVNVPRDGVKGMAVTFGLQQAWGKLEMRNITVDCGAHPLLEATQAEQAVFTGKNGQKLNYCIRRTGAWFSGGSALVVLFLHGAGERGNDNVSQLLHGARELVRYCEKNNIKAMLLFPQCPAGKMWVDTPWNLPEHKMPPQSETMTLLKEFLDDMLLDTAVDHDRVYVTGISMGGFGTWDLLSRYPELFAAAMPVCGGADTEQADKLKNIPIRTFHGDSDDVVLTKRSRDIVKAIRDAGGTKISYTEVPNCGHGVWPGVYADEKNFDWLLSQKRSK